MVESVGKRLQQARTERGLTIDEAAHATKLRPDKIAALENDDYSRFANNIYAKGFLQIYARFLHIDVADVARTLDNSNPINVSDYQYLSNAPAPRRETVSHRPEERRAPSLAPLFVFLALIAAGLGGTWFFTMYQRVQQEQASRNAAAAPPTPAASDADFISTPVPRAIAITPAPLTKPAGSPAPVAAATPPARGPDRDFVMPAPVATTDPAARSLPPGGVNEVLVAAVRKTWITIRKDDPKAPPIFEGVLYPNAKPLKLKGPRFFIEAREPAAVQITKNGLPFAHQPPGVPVQ